MDWWGKGRSAALGLWERVKWFYPDKRRRGRFVLRRSAAFCSLEACSPLALGVDVQRWMEGVTGATRSAKDTCTAVSLAV